MSEIFSPLLLPSDAVVSWRDFLRRVVDSILGGLVGLGGNSAGVLMHDHALTRGRPGGARWRAEECTGGRVQLLLLLGLWEVRSLLGLGGEVHSAGCAVAGLSSLGGARWGDAACAGGIGRGVAGVGAEGRSGGAVAPVGAEVLLVSKGNGHETGVEALLGVDGGGIVGGVGIGAGAGGVGRVDGRAGGYGRGGPVLGVVVLVHVGRGGAGGWYDGEGSDGGVSAAKVDVWESGTVCEFWA